MSRAGLPPRREPAPCILIVEDDADIREILAAVVADAGYRVVEAENGADGLTRLREDPRPSLVLLDLMMPVLDGYAFRQAQRADPALAAIPVVVFTAGALSARVDALEAHAVIRKPAPFRVVLDTISRILPR